MPRTRVASMYPPDFGVAFGLLAKEALERGSIALSEGRYVPLANAYSVADFPFGGEHLWCSMLKNASSSVDRNYRPLRLLKFKNGGGLEVQV